MTDSPLPESPGETAEPEILALLDFEPVPRAYRQKGAWTPELQRLFIARLAVTGSVNKACDDLGKDPGGARRLYKAAGGKSFRAAAEAAEALWERRNLSPPQAFVGDMPGPGRRKQRDGAQPEPAGPLPGPKPGQVRNEFGEWEDEASLQARAEDARDSISMKLRRARRLFLHDISDCPAKRAAFEILSELPIDWDRAAQCLPQEDEPWRKPKAREPDMLLTAEAGWIGEFTHGPDKKAELLAEVNAWRAEQGLPLVGWRGEAGTTDEDE